METTLRVNTERVCIINDVKDIEDQDSPKVLFINPEGRREYFEGRDYIFCKSSNVWQVKIDNGKKYSFFKNPKNFDGHIFINLNEKTMKYSLDEETCKLIQAKLEVEEVEMFLRELNKTLHLDNNILVISMRSKVISFMGWFFFSLLMISAFGILGAGIYTSQIKAGKTVVNTYNKFGSTFEAPFYLISFFIIVMAVVIYFSCVKNAILKDYHTQKLQFTLYKNKIKAIENKFNRNYFSKKGCYVSISPNLEYVHFSLKSEILKIIDLF
jgi:hypothetical protein